MEDITCSICCASMNFFACEKLPRENVCVTLCKHSFHKRCIMEWVHKQTLDNEYKITNCPLCRSQISVFGLLININIDTTNSEDIFYLPSNANETIYYD